MEIKHLDFSEFHPLDHWPWQRRCWSNKLQGGWETPFYGGPIHHVKLSWQFKWREQVLFRPLHVVFGKHHFQTWHNEAKGYKTYCIFCSEERPTRKDEEFGI